MNLLFRAEFTKSESECKPEKEQLSCLLFQSKELNLWQTGRKGTLVTPFFGGWKLGSLGKKKATQMILSGFS